MIVLNLLVGAIALAALFYWFAAAFVDISVCIQRCRGYGHSSALPFVATITGLLLIGIGKYYFKLIQSPFWYVFAILPDFILQLGNLVLLIRMRVFGWPVKDPPKRRGQ